MTSVNWKTRQRLLKILARKGEVFYPGHLRTPCVVWKRREEKYGGRLPRWSKHRPIVQDGKITLAKNGCVLYNRLS